MRQFRRYLICVKSIREAGSNPLIRRPAACPRDPATLLREAWIPRTSRGTTVIGSRGTTD